MTKKVSIIIPFYNEEQTVATIISKILKLKVSGWEKEIILINDGSTDNSYNALKQAGLLDEKIIYIQLNTNNGMGTALKTGILKATGDIILFQDADNEYSPKDIPNLVEPFEDSKIKVVYGSRYMKSSKRGYFFYYTASLFFTKLINLLYKSNLTDAFTGYKVFRSYVIKKINSQYYDFAFNVDITTKILNQGVTIYEIPINYSPRSFSEGKKISPWIGIKDSWIILKNRIF